MRSLVAVGGQGRCGHTFSGLPGRLWALLRNAFTGRRSYAMPSLVAVGGQGRCGPHLQRPGRPLVGIATQCPPSQDHTAGPLPPLPPYPRLHQTHVWHP